MHTSTLFRFRSVASALLREICAAPVPGRHWPRYLLDTRSPPPGGRRLLRCGSSRPQTRRRPPGGSAQCVAWRFRSYTMRQQRSASAMKPGRSRRAGACRHRSTVAVIRGVDGNAERRQEPGCDNGAEDAPRDHIAQSREHGAHDRSARRFGGVGGRYGSLWGSLTHADCVTT